MLKRIAPVLMLAFMLHACTKPSPTAPENTLELVVTTRIGPTTYFINHAGVAAGFEHDLVREFSRQQGWKLRWVVQDNAPAVLADVETGSAHFAAAGLSETSVQARMLRTGPVLFETPVMVVYRNNSTRPRSIADLSGKKLAILENSGHQSVMLRLKRNAPGLSWQSLSNVRPEELFARLDQGDFDAIIINGLDFDLSRNGYPNLSVAFALDYHQKLVWALPRNASPALQKKLQQFVSEARKNNTIKRILRTVLRAYQSAG